jgi:hypothetical protein
VRDEFEEQERRHTKEIGGWIMEPPRKQYITVLTLCARSSGTTGINGSSYQETSFPQGQWERALLGQQNATM